MQLLEERHDPRRDDRVEDHLRATGHDLLDGLAVVGVVERVVVLLDDLAALGRDDLADLLVHDARPDVVGRRQGELLRARLLHQPGNQGIDLLRRHRAGAEDERVGLLSLVLLRVDVERLALHDRGGLDGLPRRAEDATEDHVDLILLDELGGAGFRGAVGGLAVLEVQLDLLPEQAAAGVDLVDHHLGDVGVRDAHERQGTRLIGDHSHLDGSFQFGC